MHFGSIWTPPGGPLARLYIKSGSQHRGQENNHAFLSVQNSPGIRPWQSSRRWQMTWYTRYWNNNQMVTAAQSAVGTGVRRKAAMPWKIVAGSITATTMIVVKTLQRWFAVALFMVIDSILIAAWKVASPWRKPFVFPSSLSLCLLWFLTAGTRRYHKREISTM